MPEGGAGVGGLVVRIAGGRWFIPVGRVVEVLRDAAITRVPGTAASVRGLVNHRGKVLSVADVVRALGLPGETGAGGEVVVVEGGGRRFAVAVDGVVELAPEARTGLATLDLDQVATAIFA